MEGQEPPSGAQHDELRDQRLRRRFTRWDWRENWGAYLAAGIFFVFAGYCLVEGDLGYAMGFGILALVAATWRSTREVLAEIPVLGAVFSAKKGKDIATEKVTTSTSESQPALPDDAAAPSERPRSPDPPPG